MPREFPDWINPWTAAQGKRTYGGTIPLTRMARLGSLLEHQRGEAAFEAHFALDMDQRPVIRLHAEAELTLMCQASLQPYTTMLRRESELGVVESEAETTLLSGSLDPVVVENHRLALAELVEDELLLALPQVPRNPEVDRVAYHSGPREIREAEVRTHPFAGLKDQLAETGSKKD
ncbi:MAG: DUF177 domain-containing protein [Xanthomonadales bacterium]|nr:DUF177 domain-containing protein [Halieaceae bacterium]NRB70801.1 DUF177 domain-containing protein [Xanthomonadales bacterium]